MKKISIIVIMVCFLSGCQDAFYMEGRVKTIAVTEITNHSAVLYGKFEIASTGKEAEPQIQSTGFRLKDLNRTFREVCDNCQEEEFSAVVTNLLPNTNYQVEAFVTVRYNYGYNENEKKSLVKTFYGNTIEFTTGDGAIMLDFHVLKSDGVVVQKFDRSSGATWQQARDLCQSLNFGGYSWRLPTIGELESLYNSKETIGEFTEGRYWSDTYSGSGSNYRYVDFGTGISEGINGSNSYRCRCVSTSTPDVSDFLVLQSDGVMVQKFDRSSGATWSAADALCKSLNLGGYNDWRLPTIGELQSLYNSKETIGEYTNGRYWSDTSSGSSNSIYVDFENGSSAVAPNGESYRCRCVRNLP